MDQIRSLKRLQCTIMNELIVLKQTPPIIVFLITPQIFSKIYSKLLTLHIGFYSIFYFRSSLIKATSDEIIRKKIPNNEIL